MRCLPIKFELVIVACYDYYKIAYPSKRTDILQVQFSGDASLQDQLIAGILAQ